MEISEDKPELKVELPREIQLYIFQFLYDKWRPIWNKVMKELVNIRTKSYVISRFIRKIWNLTKVKEFTICIECGNYYKPRVYSSISMFCLC